MDIDDCLVIAGIAHRRYYQLDAEIAGAENMFPTGPDAWHLSSELALCQSLIATVRALLSTVLLELSFTADGLALAAPPASLQGGEYDNGTHEEPV